MEMFQFIKEILPNISLSAPNASIPNHKFQ